MKFKEFKQSKIGMLFHDKKYADFNRFYLEHLYQAVNGFMILEDKASILPRLGALLNPCTRLGRYILVTGENVQKRAESLAQRYSAECYYNDVEKLREIAQNPLDSYYVCWTVRKVHPVMAIRHFENAYGSTEEAILNSPD